MRASSSLPFDSYTGHRVQTSVGPFQSSLHSLQHLECNAEIIERISVQQQPDSRSGAETKETLSTSCVLLSLEMASLIELAEPLICIVSTQV